jgi:hypothetical protein
MTRAEREELRYRVVRNAYADPAIARKARGWSDERIERELGLKVTKSIPKLQIYDGPTIQRKREEYKRFEYARSIGVESKKARDLRRRKTDAPAKKERWRDWCREEQVIRQKRKDFHGYVRTYEDGGFPEQMRDEEYKRFEYARSIGVKSKKARDLRRRKTDAPAKKERWRDWCREEQVIRQKRKDFHGYVRTYEDGGFPEQMRDEAKHLNRSIATKDGSVFDEDARYAWAVLYWSYVNGWSMEYAKSRIIPDAYLGDWYKGPFKKSYSN